MPKIEVNKIHVFSGHRDALYTLSPGPVRNLIFTGSGDGMVVQWDLEEKSDGIPVARVPNSIYAICFMPDRGQLFIGHNYEGVHVIDVASRKEIASLKLTGAAIFDIHSYAGQLVAACGDGNLVFFNPDTLQVIQSVKASVKSARVISSCSSAGHMAAGFSDHFIRIYEMKTGKLIKEFKAHNNSVFSLCYSPDGRYLLSGGRDARLNIWDTGKDYQSVDSIIAHMYAINHICYSPDKEYFATCSLDKTIKIWRTRDFRLLKVIDHARHGGHITSVNRLYWSTWNNWLISASDDRTAIVWQINFHEDGTVP